AADLIGFGTARLRATPLQVVVHSAVWFTSVGSCCAARNLSHFAVVAAVPRASVLRRHSLSGLGAAVSRLHGNAQLSVPLGFGTIRGCITIRSSRNRFAVRLSSSVRRQWQDQRCPS